MKLLAFLLLSVLASQQAPREKGDVLYNLADYAGALKQYDLAIEKAPRDASAHARRAGVLVKLSRPEDALHAIDRRWCTNPAA